MSNGTTRTGDGDDADIPRPRWVSHFWLILLVSAVVGMNLRASLGAMQPVITDISRELDLGGTAQGVATSSMIVMFGVSAPFAPGFARRIGIDRALAVALLLIATGGLLRLAASEFLSLVATSVITGTGMGFAGVYFPALIVKYVRRRRGLALGFYSTGMGVGLVVGVSISVPLTRLFGDWRAALAFWGVIALLTTLLWVSLAPVFRLRRGKPRSSAPSSEVETASTGHLPWRSRVAWLVAGFSLSGQFIGFGTATWLSPIYRELGVSAEQAAIYLICLQGSSVVAMLLLPTLTDYLHDWRPLLFISLLTIVSGIALLILVPLPTAYLASCLVGFGIGGASSMTFVLVADVTRDHFGAARLNSIVMLTSFCLGAVVPVLMGTLHDLTGSFTPSLLLAVSVAVVYLPLCFRIRRGLTVD